MVQMTIDEERVDEERKDTPLAERVIPIPYILAGGAVLVFLAALLCGHATALVEFLSNPLVLGLAFILACFAGRRIWFATLTPEQKEYMANGALNPAMICPHCQTKGSVRTRAVRAKAGVSGGKATMALLTGGLSLLATGLSRTETMTQAHCTCCGNNWKF